MISTAGRCRDPQYCYLYTRDVGIVTTIAGNPASGWVDGLGTVSRFRGPMQLFLSSQNRLYLADTYSNVVRLIDLAGK
jgi:hypothetical protein